MAKHQIEHIYHIASLINQITYSNENVTILRQILDNFDILLLKSENLTVFLETYLSILFKFLNLSLEDLSSEVQHHEARKTTLYILHRIPLNENTKTFSSEILKNCIPIIISDNELNAIIAVKIALNHILHFEPYISSDMQHLFDHIYKELIKIQSIFDNTSDQDVSYILNIENDFDKIEPENLNLNVKSKLSSPCSFKLLAQLVFLYTSSFQLYSEYLNITFAEVLDHIIFILKIDVQHIRSRFVNMDMFFHFLSLQVKCVFFLSSMAGKYYMEILDKSPLISQSLYSIMKSFPLEMVFLHRELLISFKNLITSGLHTAFRNNIDAHLQLEYFSDCSYFSPNCIRFIHYQSIFELVINLFKKEQLSISQLQKAIYRFAKLLNNENLSPSIHILAARTITSLCNSFIFQQSDNSIYLSQKLLNFLLLKFTYLAEHQVPFLIQEFSSFDSKNNVNDSLATIQIKDDVFEESSIYTIFNEDEFVIYPVKFQSSFFSFSMISYLNDIILLIKTALLSLEKITLTINDSACMQVSNSWISSYISFKHGVYEVLFKNILLSFRVFDIVDNLNYFLSSNPTSKITEMLRKISVDKEAFDIFAKIFANISHSTLKSVFQANISMLMNFIESSSDLISILTIFLTSDNSNLIVSNFLIEYILNSFQEISKNQAQSKLYLKIIKLIFQEAFPTEVEFSLKSPMHLFVKSSLSNCMSAENPLFYFHTLKIIFHRLNNMIPEDKKECIYKDLQLFLNDFLFHLNRFHTTTKHENIKDLIIEIVFSIPFRAVAFSSFRDIIGLLISALNHSSETFIRHGLDCLAYFLDIVHPNELFDCFSTFKHSLIQSLLMLLNHCNSTIAYIVFTLLGKFGGNSRKLLSNFKCLPDYTQNNCFDSFLILNFSGFEEVSFKMNYIISYSKSILEESRFTTFYLDSAWLIIKYYLLSLFSEEDYLYINNLGISQFFKLKKKIPTIYVENQISPITVDKDYFVLFDAFLGMFNAAFLFKGSTYTFAELMIKHVLLLHILIEYKKIGMEYFDKSNILIQLLVKSIVTLMHSSNENMYTFMEKIINSIFEICSSHINKKENISFLRLFDYFFIEFYFCCFHGGLSSFRVAALGIQLLVNNLNVQWIIEHQIIIIKSLLNLLSSIEDEITYGIIPHIKNTLLTVVAKFANNYSFTDKYLSDLQSKNLDVVLSIFVHNISSPNDNIRDGIYLCLNLLSKTIFKISMFELLSLKKLLLDKLFTFEDIKFTMLPKVLLIGLLDGFRFSNIQSPALFTLDLNNPHQQKFVKFIFSICDPDDALYRQSDKNEDHVISICKSALYTITSLKYIRELREKVFQMLCKIIRYGHADIVGDAKICMESFNLEYNDQKLAHDGLRVFLNSILRSHTNLNTPLLKRLLCMIRLFPSSFNEKFCDQLLLPINNHLKSLMNNQNRYLAMELEKVSLIIKMFHHLPASTFKHFDNIVTVIIHLNELFCSEINYDIYNSILKFAIKFPELAVDMFLKFLPNVHNSFNLFAYLLHQKEGESLVIELMKRTVKIEHLFRIHSPDVNRPLIINFFSSDSLVYYGCYLSWIIVNKYPSWIIENERLSSILFFIWDSTIFHTQVSTLETYIHLWELPKILSKCLMCIIQSSTLFSFERLFSLVRFRCHDYFCSMEHLNDFFKTNICLESSISKRREILFGYLSYINNNQLDDSLHSIILHYLIIPLTQIGLQQGPIDKFICGINEIILEDNLLISFISSFVNFNNQYIKAFPLKFLMLKLACLFVEYAHSYIHDDSNNKQDSRVRQLMNLAWPSLYINSFADPLTKYYGHLLLAHIISKFAIHRKIIIQVFSSLLKPSNNEMFLISKALNIIIPILTSRIDDGTFLMIQISQQSLNEETNICSMMHVISMILDHQHLFFNYFQKFIYFMITALQQLSYNNSKKDNCRILNILQVVLKWEIKQAKDIDTCYNNIPQNEHTNILPTISITNKLYNNNDKSLEYSYFSTLNLEYVINYLFKNTCYQAEVIDFNSSEFLILPNEQTRSFSSLLAYSILQPEISNIIIIKSNWINTLFNTSMIDFNSIGWVQKIETTFKWLIFIINAVPSNSCAFLIQPFAKSLISLIFNSNIQIIQSFSEFYSTLLILFPHDNISTKEYYVIIDLYHDVNEFIRNTLQNFEHYSLIIIYAVLLLCNCNIKINLNLILTNMKYIISIFQYVIKDQIQDNNQLEVIENHQIQFEDLISDIFSLIYKILITLITYTSNEQRKILLSSICIIATHSNSINIILNTLIFLKQILFSSDSSIVGPSWKEKVQYLKRIKHVTERFKSNSEINRTFYFLIYEIFSSPELTAIIRSGLQELFLDGMKHNDHEIRFKFFKLYSFNLKSGINHKLYNLFICQNWEKFGEYYWIKICINSILSENNCKSKLNFHHSEDKSNISKFNVKIHRNISDNEIIPNLYYNYSSNINQTCILSTMVSEINFENMLSSICNLCYLDDDLSHKTWIQLFSSIWKLMPQIDKKNILPEFSPFLVSSSHITQSECKCSAIKTMFEGFAHSIPSLFLRPPVLLFLGKNYNSWFRSILMLENYIESFRFKKNNSYSVDTEYEFNYDSDVVDTLKCESYECLAELYYLLNEEDLLTGLWRNKSIFSETNTAMSFESQGFFEEAQSYFESAMNKTTNNFTMNFPYSVITEYKLWEAHWIRCSKELGQWDLLNDFGTSQGVSLKPLAVLHSAWRLADWSAVKGANSFLEDWNHTNDLLEINLHKCYLALFEYNICDTVEVQKYVKLATFYALKKWKNLPFNLISVHIPLLQLTHKILEIQEASQIICNLQLIASSKTFSHSWLEIKTIPKVWRERLPNKFDNLSYWSDILNLRQHMFKAIVSNCEGFTFCNLELQNPTLIAFQNSAFSFIKYASIARKQGLINVCLDALVRIMNIPQVQPIDLFIKQREKMKCYIKVAHQMNEPDLLESLADLDSTDTSSFSPLLKSEFYGYKSVLLCQIGNPEDANNLFGKSLHTCENNSKSWGQWGEFMDQMFLKQVNEYRIIYAKSALACYLQGCQGIKISIKTRMYISRTLWIITYIDEFGNLDEILQTFIRTINPQHWIPWIREITNLSFLKNKLYIIEILYCMCKCYPQVLFFKINSILFYLKSFSENDISVIEKIEHLPFSFLHNISNLDRTINDIIEKNFNSSDHQYFSYNASFSESKHISIDLLKVKDILNSFSRIDDYIYHHFPTTYIILRAFTTTILDLVSWDFYLISILKSLLQKSKSALFKNRSLISNLILTIDMASIINNLIEVFKQIANLNNLSYIMRVLFIKIHVKLNDHPNEIFTHLREKFIQDFGILDINKSCKVTEIIKLSKKWLKILNNHILKSKDFLNNINLLTNFTNSITNINVFGKPTCHYHSESTLNINKILKPIVSTINSNPSIIFNIIATNGINYTYNVNIYSNVFDSKCDETIHNLLISLNPYLMKTKETAKRYLSYELPYLEFISPIVSITHLFSSMYMNLEFIFNNFCKKESISIDTYFKFYYEEILKLKSQESKETLNDLKKIYHKIQNILIPNFIIKKYIISLFSDPNDYWTFRRKFVNSISLINITEYLFFLLKIYPKDFLILCDRGGIYVSNKSFDFDLFKFECQTPLIPFRLTSSISHFLTHGNLFGPLLSNMISISRCYAQSNFSIIGNIAIFLSNFYIDQHIKDFSITYFQDLKHCELLFNQVSLTLSSIKKRIEECSQFEEAKSPIEAIIEKSISISNLCLLCPSWNSWL